MSTCYAMNTFVSPVTGFSPYELVFLKKPPDLLNLYFQPLETVAKDFREYCVKMKARLNEVATVVMEMKAQQQQRQAELAAARPEPLQTFQEDQLVYLLAPSASSLKTKTRKCIADFVGPLVISRVLDSTHYVLSDLQGCILVGVYHINRLKAAHVRTPSGVVSTYSQLRVAFQNIHRKKPTGQHYLTLLQPLYYNLFTINLLYTVVQILTSTVLVYWILYHIWISVYLYNHFNS